MEEIVNTDPVPAVEESEITDAEMMGSDSSERTASVVSGRGDGPCEWSLTAEQQVSNLQKNWKSAFTLTVDGFCDIGGRKKVNWSFERMYWLEAMFCSFDDKSFLAEVLGRLRTAPCLETFKLEKIKNSPGSSVLQLKMTSLDLAILMGDLKMVQTIVAKSSLPKPIINTVRDVDSEGFFNTPLHWAVLGGNSDIVDVLLEKDKNVNATNWLAQTPLDLACKLEGVEILLKLIEHDEKGRDPLHVAVPIGDIDFIKKLPFNGNVVDKWKRTPLHYLASRPYFSQARNIVKYFAEDKTLDVRALDKYGHSAIYLAVLYCNTKVVLALLDFFKEHMRLNEICNERFGPPIQIAIEGGEEFKDIEGALMECNVVKGYMESLYVHFQVYGGAINTILIGAALIASVTFASWLQPPLNYTSYLGEGYSSSIPTPSTSNVNYVDVEHNNALHAFWIFNALSFYFAIATIICGAQSVLPKNPSFIKKNVDKLRTNLLVTSILLACSLLFVIIAFALAGTIVLKPLLKYQWYMIVSTIVGGIVCIISLVYLIKSIAANDFNPCVDNLHTRLGLNKMYS